MKNRNQWPLLGLCLLPFLPGIIGPFMLDDLPNLEPVFAAIAHGDWQNAVLGNTSGFLGRPLAMASFASNAWLFGELPLTYKLVNLLLHGLNGLLVFAFVKALLAAIGASLDDDRRNVTALLAAALWLVHPLQVSTALYVVQRMTLLASTGMLLALIVCTRHLGNGRFDRASNLRTIAMMALYSVAALLSKEIAILVPALSGVLALFVPLPHAQTEHRGRQYFVLAISVLPTLILVVLAIFFKDAITAGYASRDFSLGQRLSTEPVILLGYLRSIFWPDIRSMGLFLAPPLHQPGDTLALASIVALTISIFAAMATRRRMPVAGFALAWFLTCHLLESTFVPLELAFEHRNYLALVGPAVLVATLIARIHLSYQPIIAGMLCIVLAGITTVRAREWSDEGRFIQFEAARHPTSFRAMNNLGEYYFRTGDAKRMAKTTALMAARFPGNFFVQSQKMILIACHLLPGPPDWRTARAAALRKPADPWASSSLGAIADNINPPSCDGISPSDLHAFVQDLLNEYRRRGLNANAADALVALARIQHNANDTEGHYHLLREAIDENPASNAAGLELLATYIATGKTVEATELASKIKPRLKPGRETRRFNELTANTAPSFN